MNFPIRQRGLASTFMRYLELLWTIAGDPQVSAVVLSMSGVGKGEASGAREHQKLCSQTQFLEMIPTLHILYSFASPWVFPTK